MNESNDDIILVIPLLVLYCISVFLGIQVFFNRKLNVTQRVLWGILIMAVPIVGYLMYLSFKNRKWEQRHRHKWH
jgi:uncharacterized membrane protein